MNGCGYIASVGGWIESCSRDFIGSLIESMRADVVLVIGAERMFADVKQAVEGRGNIEVRPAGLMEQQTTVDRL